MGNEKLVLRPQQGQAIDVSSTVLKKNVHRESAPFRMATQPAADVNGALLRAEEALRSA